MTSNFLMVLTVKVYNFMNVRKDKQILKMFSSFNRSTTFVYLVFNICMCLSITKNSLMFLKMIMTMMAPLMSVNIAHV